ncbi:hypothetical protein Hrd1104_10405 [Halorhabdus sp. CBA1104]|uniref:hypothetical protein n=1 Tax=Halorhabdus sp. CBA1104 TaxID=1380432 RepID=UPI0012B35EE1|nr:hypothetical protein [Halorhabdus sp. CBA1104]QGN07666.1 hypothetical protein Hrd1104_10405 [Halorhabdus sp. CBA1104]
MHRRELLTLGGLALAGLAGCLDNSGTSGDDQTETEPSTPTDTNTSTVIGTTTPTETNTETPTETTTIGESSQLSVSIERLQPAVVEMGTPDSLTVTGGEETQYLYLWIEVAAGKAPARDDLTFRLGGERHALRPSEHTLGLWRAYNHSEKCYDAERGSGWVLFELPDLDDASDPTLVWPGGEWQPGADIRQRLSSQAPSLSVEWSAPDTVTVGDQPPIEFTVTNESDRPGRFVAALNRTGGGIVSMPVAGISKSIPAGETVSWSLTDTYDIRAPGGDEQIGDGEPDMTYNLALIGDRLEQDIRIVAG